MTTTIVLGADGGFRHDVEMPKGRVSRTGRYSALQGLLSFAPADCKAEEPTHTVDLCKSPMIESSYNIDHGELVIVDHRPIGDAPPLRFARVSGG